MVKRTLPKVILHVAVSLDGKTEGFDPDVGLFYRTAGKWKEDATLAGSDTLLASPETIPPETRQDRDPPAGVPGDKRPLLVVPDSRGRIRTWHHWRKQPYWRGVLVLCSKRTPESYLRYLRSRNIPHAICGSDRVDLKRSLALLHAKHGIRTVRVDSGGRLNAALLDAGLVDEVSLLVHPCIVGLTSARSFYPSAQKRTLKQAIRLEWIRRKKMDGGVEWIVARVLK
jgi:2,5-diamino-6-(ribosylamino)-4(3H)-pyrimidinone 5'-phosphate reductase